MTVTLQKIVEQLNALSQEEQEELRRFLANRIVRKQACPRDQAQLLASIRRRRSFSPADYDLPDSLLMLREDRGR